MFHETELWKIHVYTYVRVVRAVENDLQVSRNLSLFYKMPFREGFRVEGTTIGSLRTRVTTYWHFIFCTVCETKFEHLHTKEKGRIKKIHPDYLNFTRYIKKKTSIL